MKVLKEIQDTLTCCVKEQMTHLKDVDTKELGEAVDMIKDLSEAIYYCTIVEAMHGDERQEKEWHNIDKEKGRMYYDGMGPVISSPNARRPWGYEEREFPPIMRDAREGRSPMSRKMYMESKEMHKDKAAQMQELEKYMQELTSDMVEMIEGATPEEKQILANRISQLATKIK